MESPTAAQMEAVAELEAEHTAYDVLTKRYMFYARALSAAAAVAFLVGAFLAYRQSPQPMSNGLIVYFMMIVSFMQIVGTWLGIWYKRSYTKDPDLAKIIREEASSHCYGVALLLMSVMVLWPWVWILVVAFFLLGVTLSLIRLRRIFRESAARTATLDEKRRKNAL